MALAGFLLCLVFPAVLALAAWGDVAHYRIPNMLSIVLALAYLPAALATGAGAAEIGWHLGAGFVVLLGGMALFFTGLFGGGDAKILAAAACWTGFAALAPFLIVVALAGGGLALLLLVLRTVLHRGFGVTSDDGTRLARIVDRPCDVPYGIAIAVGGIVCFPLLAPVIGALGLG